MRASTSRGWPSARTTGWTWPSPTRTTNCRPTRTNRCGSCPGASARRSCLSRDCENASTIHTDPSPNTCHVDGLRDLTVYLKDSEQDDIGNQTISAVFDAQRPAPDPVTETERWGIPTNALHVENFRYPTQDYLSYLAMHETPRILSNFDKYGADIYPTLLYAREEHYRSAGLEAVTASGGGALTLQVGSAYKEKTLAGLSWAPYRQGNDGWEAYPIDEYWYTLDDSLRATFIDQYAGDTAETIDGRVAVAESYYMSLLSGIESDDPMSGCPAGEEECPYPTEEGESYENIIQASEKFTSRISHVATEIGEEISHIYHKRVAFLTGDVVFASCPGANDPSCPGLFKSIGEGLDEFAVSPWHEMFAGGTGAAIGVTIIAGAAISAVVLTIITLSHASGTEAIAAVMRGLTTVIATMAAAKAIAKFIKDFGGGSFTDVIKTGFHEQAFHLKEQKAGIIALVIHVVVTWAAWGLEWGLNHLSAGSMEWDNSLANTIAASITAIVMFAVLAIIPLGEVITAIIGLIDALCAQICNAFLTEEQLESNWAAWVCGGITGFVTQIYKKVVYSGTLLPDMDPKEGSASYPRLVFSGFGIDLQEPEDGIVEGNQHSALHLVHKHDRHEQPADRFAGDHLLVAVQQGQPRDLDLRLQVAARRRGHRRGDEPRGMDRPGVGRHGRQAAGPLHEPQLRSRRAPAPARRGINQSMDNVYLSEGYALPEQECWGWAIAKACYIATEKGTVHYPIGEDLVFDVLPADARRLLQPGARGAGYALGWDPEFPALKTRMAMASPRPLTRTTTTGTRTATGLSDFYEQETGAAPPRSTPTRTA